MKRNTAYITLLFIILLIVDSGCVNDDLSVCYTNNIELDFFLYPNNQARFMQRIQSVDVFVFDSDSLFVTSKRVEKNSMQQPGFLGTYLSLFPGNYLIACWANAGSSTEISPMKECQTFLGLTRVAMTAVPGDSLYYAPARLHANSGTTLFSPGDAIGMDTLYNIEVESGGQTVKSIEFVRAYRSINVYIKGITSKTAQPSLVVELSEVATQYDFAYHTLTSLKKSFTRSAQMADLEAGTILSTHFYTIYEPITDNIKVTVKDPATGITLGSVGLLSYINNNPGVDRDDIDILFEFADNTLITITLPPWSTNPVTPIY